MPESRQYNQRRASLLFGIKRLREIHIPSATIGRKPIHP
jgi:hypothetical protein